MLLSKNIQLIEMVRSETADSKHLDNTPQQEVIDAMQRLAQEVLQPIRAHFDKPLHISSGYRCQELNKAIGGSKTSQHCFGEAADISVAGTGISELMAWIVNDSGLPFDQVILEPSWVHISYTVRHELRYESMVKVPNGYIHYKENGAQA